MGRLNWNKRAVDLISTNGVRSRSVMSIRVTGVQSYLQKQRFWTIFSAYFTSCFSSVQIGSNSIRNCFNGVQNIVLKQARVKKPIYFAEHLCSADAFRSQSPKFYFLCLEQLPQGPWRLKPNVSIFLVFQHSILEIIKWNLIEIPIYFAS